MSCGDRLTPLILTIVLMSSCVFTNKNFKKREALEPLCHDWRIDSLGCEGNRSLSIFEEICDSTYLSSDNSYVKLLADLGKPNKQTNQDSLNILKYYLNAFCDDGEVVDSMDICYLEIHFNKNSYFRHFVVCY
jgi:hypothetical protein